MAPKEKKPRKAESDPRVCGIVSVVVTLIDLVAGLFRLFSK